MATHWIGKHSESGLTVISGYRMGAVQLLDGAFELSSKQRKELEIRLYVKLPRHGHLEIETCDCSDGKHES